VTLSSHDANEHRALLVSRGRMRLHTERGLAAPLERIATIAQVNVGQELRHKFIRVPVKFYNSCNVSGLFYQIAQPMLEL
jgi:hypothetical protein